MAWLKLSDETVRDLRLRGFTVEQAITWLAILCIASRETREYRGLLVTNRRPTQGREIAMEAGTTEEDVASTITFAKSWDMLVVSAHPVTGEQVYEVANWDLMQVDRTARERKERERATAVPVSD